MLYVIVGHSKINPYETLLFNIAKIKRKTGKYAEKHEWLYFWRTSKYLVCLACHSIHITDKKIEWIRPIALFAIDHNYSRSNYIILFINRISNAIENQGQLDVENIKVLQYFGSFQNNFFCISRKKNNSRQNGQFFVICVKHSRVGIHSTLYKDIPGSNPWAYYKLTFSCFYIIEAHVLISVIFFFSWRLLRELCQVLSAYIFNLLQKQIHQHIFHFRRVFNYLNWTKFVSDI